MEFQHVDETMGTIGIDGGRDRRIFFVEDVFRPELRGYIEIDVVLFAFVDGCRLWIRTTILVSGCVCHLSIESNEGLRTGVSVGETE